MFSIEDILSQGDQDLGFGDFSDHLGDQCFLSQEFLDFKFLDSFTEISDSTINNTSMNLDLKGDVMAEKAMDVSLLNMNTAIPDSELSHYLNNTTIEGDLIFMEADILGKELSYDLETFVDGAQLPKNDSSEVSGSAEVSSTTNTLFDLLDDDLLQESGGSEIGESVAGRKYLEMRKKNNVASQKSRKIRKQKNSKMAERLKVLQKENKELSSLAEELEKERNTLQELLMSVIAKKS